MYSILPVAAARPPGPPTYAEPERRHRISRLWSNLQEVFDLLRLPAVLSTTDIRFQHVQFKARQRVHMIGQPFEFLYVVNSGFLKTVTVDETGHEQVIGFPMKGDLLGIDGIQDKRYATETVTLTNCDIVLIPFKVMISLGRAHPDTQSSFYSMMSRELLRKQVTVSNLGSFCAEARVARFLCSLAERFMEMGCSGTHFDLRMTREEIGSYLGVSLETVSRTLSAFAARGLISVKQRTIEIRNQQALRTLRRLPTRRQQRKRGGNPLTAPA